MNEESWRRHVGAVFDGLKRADLSASYYSEIRSQMGQVATILKGVVVVAGLSSVAVLIKVAAPSPEVVSVASSVLSILTAIASLTLTTVMESEKKAQSLAEGWMRQLVLWEEAWSKTMQSRVVDLSDIISGDAELRSRNGEFRRRTKLILKIQDRVDRVRAGPTPRARPVPVRLEPSAVEPARQFEAVEADEVPLGPEDAEA